MMKIYVAVNDHSYGKILLKRWKIRNMCGLQKYQGQSHIVDTCFSGVFKIVFYTNSEVVFYIKRELMRSRLFATGFIRWIGCQCSNVVIGKSRETITPLAAFGSLCSVVLSHVIIPLCTTCNTKHKLPTIQPKTINVRNMSSMIVLLHGHNPVTLCMTRDICWSSKLNPLVVRKLQLEYLMACLSTLGGAHASLGDFSSYHSTKAGLISLQQYIIASRLEDPILSSRCKLYLAHSYMQRGYLRKAAEIIRAQYVFAKTAAARTTETFLVTCCQAAWCRLQYLYKLKRSKHL